MGVDDYSNLFEQAGQQYNVDPSLLRAVAHVESSGNPNAVGPQTKYGRAVGLMQLIPDTAKRLGVTNPKDPKQAIPAAARLMAENLDTFGNPTDAIMAYHGGTDKANWGPKTQNYLAKVAATYGGKAQSAKPMKQSDDDLINAYLGGNAPAQAAGQPHAAMSDDALLSAYMGGNSAAPSKGKPQPPKAVRKAGFIDEFMNGALFGFGDEIGSVGGATQKTINRLMAGKPTQFAQDYSDTLDATRAGMKDYEGQHPILSGIGNVLGGVSVAPELRGGMAAAKLTTKAPGLLAKLGQGAKQGAVYGGLYGFGSGEGGVKNRLQNAGVTAAVGGVVGGALPVAYASGKKVVNSLLGSDVDPHVAQLAKMAIDQYSIPVRGGQISSSPFVGYADSQLSKVPFTGYAAKNEAQHAAFTRAVSKTFGEDADAITQPVMQQAKARIGNMFEQVAANTNIKADPQLGQALQGVFTEAHQVLPEGEVKPIVNQLENIRNSIDPQTGEISGKTYQALTRKGAPLDRAASSNNPNIRHYAGAIRSALDDALQRSASPADVDLIRTARTQWKNMRTIEDLAEKAGPSGRISPAALLNQVRKSYSNYAYTGAGDLGNLANIGQQFLKEPPSSGTAERLTFVDLLKSLGAMGGAALGATEPHLGAAAAGGAAGLVGGANILGRVLDSGPYRNHLINSGLRNAGHISPSATNALIEKLLPYAVAPAVLQGAGNRLLGPAQ